MLWVSQRWTRWPQSDRLPPAGPGRLPFRCLAPCDERATGPQPVAVVDGAWSWVTMSRRSPLGLTASRTRSSSSKLSTVRVWPSHRPHLSGEPSWPSPMVRPICPGSGWGTWTEPAAAVRVCVRAGTVPSPASMTSHSSPRSCSGGLARQGASDMGPHDLPVCGEAGRATAGVSVIPVVRVLGEVRMPRAACPAAVPQFPAHVSGPVDGPERVWSCEDSQISGR